MASSGWVSFIAVSWGVTRSLRSVLKQVSGGSKIKQAGDPEGDNSVPLLSELGQQQYTKLREDVNLTLEYIYYCQRKLGDGRINAQGDEHGQETVSPVQDELKRKTKDLINHNYLVLKLRPGDTTAEDVHIKAEKNDEGIHIKHIPSSDVTSVFHEGVRFFTVACSETRIRLEALVAILKKENPDYSVLYANCWYYAQKTAKRLVKACIETPGISSAEKVRLKEEHDNLEPNLIVKHLQNVKQTLRLRASPS